MSAAMKLSGASLSATFGVSIQLSKYIQINCTSGIGKYANLLIIINN